MNNNTKTEFTAGPWEVESGMVQTAYTHKDCKLSVDCGVKVPIAYMDRKAGNGTLPCERDANAYLIAAAPELLDALLEIHKLYLCPTPKTMRDWSARVDVMADFARKAIAKAEGR